MGERGGNPSRGRRALFARTRAWLRRAYHREAGRDVIGRPAEALESYKKIIDLASAQAKIGVWECDLATGALAWSDGVYALFELPPQAKVLRAEAVAFYHPASRDQMEALRARAIRERSRFTLDARIRTAKGNERWMRLTADVECRNDVPVRLFGMKQDITDEKNLLERLRILAETDLLTGLVNRGRFQARLEAATDVPAALLLIDLDGFKQVNDTFGHQAGDECLKQVATRLRAVCPPSALIARLGGDEFAIIVEPGSGDIDTLVATLLGDLRRPPRWNGLSIAIGVSIGVSMPEPSLIHDASRLLHEADLALYAAKAAGRGTSRTFSPELRAKADARLRTIEAAVVAELQFDLFPVAPTAPGDRMAA